MRAVCWPVWDSCWGLSSESDWKRLPYSLALLSSHLVTLTVVSPSTGDPVPLVRWEHVLMTPCLWWGENVSSWPCAFGEVRMYPHDPVPLVRWERVLMTLWPWWDENMSSWPCAFGEVRTGPPITAKVLSLSCWQLVITIGGSTENRDGEETIDCGRRADSSSTRSWCWGWTRCTLRVPWGSWGPWGPWTQPLLPPCRKVCAWAHLPVCLTQ